MVGADPHVCIAFRNSEQYPARPGSLPAQRRADKLSPLEKVPRTASTPDALRRFGLRPARAQTIPSASSSATKPTCSVAAGKWQLGAIDD